MNRGIIAVALVGMLFVALACETRQPIAPLVRDGGALLAQVPADGNGSKQIISVDDRFTVDCGTEMISAHALGWLQIRTLDRADTRNVEVVAVNIVFTMTNSDGETFVWREVGSDHFTIDQDGFLLHALNGRAGAFGIIGRLVIDEDTDELEFVAGHRVGNAFANACAALT